LTSLPGRHTKPVGPQLPEGRESTVDDLDPFFTDNLSVPVISAPP